MIAALVTACCLVGGVSSGTASVVDENHVLGGLRRSASLCWVDGVCWSGGRNRGLAGSQYENEAICRVANPSHCSVSNATLGEVEAGPLHDFVGQYDGVSAPAAVIASKERR